MEELDKYEKEAASRILDKIDGLNQLVYRSASTRSGTGMMVGNMLTKDAVISMNIEMLSTWVMDVMKEVRITIADLLSKENPTFYEESEGWLTALALYRIAGLGIDDWLMEELQENCFMPRLRDVILETRPSDLSGKLREIRTQA